MVNLKPAREFRTSVLRAATALRLGPQQAETHAPPAGAPRQDEVRQVAVPSLTPGKPRSKD